MITGSCFLKARAEHLSRRKVVCHICQENFTYIQNLKEHLQQSHNSQGIHQCSSCPKTFKSNIDLNNHTYRTHKQKRYACPTCDLSFNRKDNLRVHIQIHLEKEVKIKTGKQKSVEKLQKL